VLRVQICDKICVPAINYSVLRFSRGRETIETKIPKALPPDPRIPAQRSYPFVTRPSFLDFVFFFISFSLPKNFPIGRQRDLRFTMEMNQVVCCVTRCRRAGNTPSRVVKRWDRHLNLYLTNLNIQSDPEPHGFPTQFCMPIRLGIAILNEFPEA
jgi:hypothetical protein